MEYPPVIERAGDVGISVFTTRLGGVKVELEPLRRRIPLNVARA